MTQALKNSFYCLLILMLTNVKIHGEDQAENNQTAPFYTGNILPTPQSVKYYNNFTPIFSLSDPNETSACILLEKTIAANDARISDLVKRIQELGGKIEIKKDGDSIDKFKTIISIGETKLKKQATDIKAPEKPEGYCIATKKLKNKDVIFLAPKDKPGVFWGIQTLRQLLTVKENKIVLRQVDVIDYPAYKERYPISTLNYGLLMKHPMLFYDFAKNLLNYKFSGFYLGGLRYWTTLAELEGKMEYKEASRLYWRRKYSKEKLKNLKDTATYFNARGTKFIPIVHPQCCPDWDKPEITKKIIISDPEQVELLISHIRQLIDSGCDTISLWLDDYAMPLPAKDKEFFKNGGKAHAFLINAIYKQMKKEYSNFNMTFCSSLYYTSCEEMAKTKYKADIKKYWEALRDEVPDEIPFFWNGPNVCSYKVTDKDAEVMEKILKKKLIFLDFGWNGGHFHDSYHFDPLPIEKRLPKDFYKHVLGYARPFHGLPHVEVFYAQVADYMWNPEAFDANRSLKEAIAKVMGPDMYEISMEWNKQLSKFDQYGLRITPGAVKNLPLIKKELEKLEDIQKRFAAKTKRKEMGESLRHYVIGIKKYIAKLEKADFPNLKKDKAKLLKIAKQETSLKDGDIFMPSMDFTGGGGTGKYSYKCQPRYAIWAYAPDSVASMTCEFDLDKKQAKAPKSSLFICAQDDDSDKKCKISISINGHEIFKGENDFGRFKWDLRRFEIPASYLVEGKNILTVTNTEESDNISGPPFFMISYAALVF